VVDGNWQEKSASSTIGEPMAPHDVTHVCGQEGLCRDMLPCHEIQPVVPLSLSLFLLPLPLLSVLLLLLLLLLLLPPRYLALMTTLLQILTCKK